MRSVSVFPHSLIGFRRLCSAVASASLERASDAPSSDSNNSAVERALKSPMKTANNVITSSQLLRDTVDALYGENGTVGIAKWKRFSLLNEYLRGFRLAEVTVLTGPTGSGKTTFLSEYSLDLAEQGVRTLWCNFELRNSHLCAMMVRQLHSTFDRPLDPGSIERGEMARMVVDLSNRLPLLFAAFNGAAKVDTVLSTIREQQRVCPVDHVILDNLQFMLGSYATGGANPFFAQDNIFGRIRRLATEQNIHFTIVIHPRKLAESELGQELSVHSLYGGCKASQEADNILLIQTRRNGEDFTKYLQVISRQPNRQAQDQRDTRPAGPPSNQGQEGSDPGAVRCSNARAQLMETAIAKNRYFGDTYMGDRMHLAFYKNSQRHRLFLRKADFGSFSQKDKRRAA